MRVGPRAFSLLETLVVVVVTAMAVGLATIHMQELSDEGCLWAAADRVGGAMRIAQFQAATSRTPIRLQIGGKVCTVAKAVPGEGSWEWMETLRIELPPKAHVREVTTTLDGVHMIADGEWSTMIPAAGWLGEYRLTMELDNGRRGAVQLNAASGRVKLEVVGGPRVAP